MLGRPREQMLLVGKQFGAPVGEPDTYDLSAPQLHTWRHVADLLDLFGAHALILARLSRWSGPRSPTSA